MFIFELVLLICVNRIVHSPINRVERGAYRSAICYPESEHFDVNWLLSRRALTPNVCLSKEQASAFLWPL